MTTIKVKGMEYKLKFGYKSFKHSGILKEVAAIENKLGDAKSENEKSTDNANSDLDALENVFDVASKLVLAALQKNHEEFRVDYSNPDSVQKAIDKVDDLIDDYTDEEDSMPIMDLFHALVDELLNNGFLSKKSPKLEAAMEAQDATVVPIDHMRAGN